MFKSRGQVKIFNSMSHPIFYGLTKKRKQTKMGQVDRFTILINEYILIS